MAVTEYVTGSHAVDTTEWSCTTDTAGPDADTTAGVFQLFLDLSDMVAGDQLQIVIYEKTRSTSTQRSLTTTFLSGAQSDPQWASLPFAFKNGWDFTLKALAGTITVEWSIRQVG